MYKYTYLYLTFITNSCAKTIHGLPTFDNLILHVLHFSEVTGQKAMFAPVLSKKPRQNPRRSGGVGCYAWDVQ